MYTDQRGDIPLDPAYDDLEVEREYGSAEFQVVCRRQLGSKFKTNVQHSAVETHTYHFKAESSAIAAEWTQLIKGVAWEDLAEKAKAKKEKEKK